MSFDPFKTFFFNCKVLFNNRQCRELMFILRFTVTQANSKEFSVECKDVNEPNKNVLNFVNELKIFFSCLTFK